MRREKITIGSFVHVYNRGNRKQEIIRQSKDRWHFLEMLYYFNTNSSTGRPFRDLKKTEMERSNLSKQGRNPFVWPGIWPSRKPIVKIMAFCLMPNHFHLFLKEIVEGGVSIFMKKLGNGMTGYFNLKHKETGRLFQGPYKMKRIDEEMYFKYLSVYIQVKNVFELYPGGYEKAVQEFDKAYEWAIKYPYGSLADYAGKRNSPIIDKDVLGELFSSPEEYKEFARQCLEEIDLDEKLSKFRLE
ncbi:MAG: transposase [Patescibacteria group bacterium]